MAHEQGRGLSGRGGGAGRFRAVASGAAPLALVAVLVLYVSGPGSTMLEVGVPLPEVTIERGLCRLGDSCDRA